MPEILIYCAFSLMLIVHVVGCVAFMRYLQKLHKAQNEYLYEALKKIEPTIPGPATIANKSEKPIVKGKSWLPSKDIDHRMSGKIIDPWR